MDVRASGSGNIGATNVARTAGLGLGVLTLVVDVAKGALPVVVARRLGLGPATTAAVGLAAMYGHIFSVFAGFRGGKGVATVAGVFAALAPLALMGSLTFFVAVALRWRIVSLASLVAGIAMPILAVVLDYPATIVMAAIVAGVTVVATHRDNIRRIINGTEPRFETKSAG